MGKHKGVSDRSNHASSAQSISAFGTVADLRELTLHFVKSRHSCCEAQGSKVQQQYST